MLPFLLGAAGATWLATQLAPNRESYRLNFPFVPYDWWTPRDRLFTIKEKALTTLKNKPALAALYRGYASAHPEHTLGLLLRSMAESNEGDWATARATAELLVEREPTYSISYARLMNCCLQLGDRRAALAAIERFLELEPDSQMVKSLETMRTRLTSELEPVRAKPKPRPVPKAKAAPRAPRQKRVKAPTKKTKAPQ